MRILWLSSKSLYSTRRIQATAERLGIELTVCEVADIAFCVDGKGFGIFAAGANLIDGYNVLIVRTFYPNVSEVLTIARLFHEAGKLVIDESVTDEGYAISKMHDYLVLAGNQINVPRTWQVYSSDNVKLIVDRIGYPCILKGVHGAHGNHVHLVQNEMKLRECFTRYAPGELCVQEFLPAEEDYRVLVIGYEALPQLLSRKPYPGEFVTNSAAKAEFRPRRIEGFPDLRALAERASRVLRREFAGVDIRYQDRTPVVLEVNRQPTFEGFEMATSIDVATIFLRYVQKRFHGQRAN